MRFHFYSSALAALTGGDGMYRVTPLPSLSLDLTDPLIRYLYTNLARSMFLTLDQALAEMDRGWLTMVLGYDPQLLLPPSPFTCRRCGTYGCFLGGPDDTKGICATCCPIENEEHVFEFERGEGWNCLHCGQPAPADYPPGDDW